MIYANKAGQVYKGSKPDGMSDEEYRDMMAKKGYKGMSKADYEKAYGHGNTAPSPHKDKKEPLNSGNPSGMSKSEEEVTVSALEKALLKLNEFATLQDPENEKAWLLSKAVESDLSEEENNRLRDLLAGETGETQEAPLSKSVTEGLENDERIQKAVEVSDYLEALHVQSAGALTELAETLEKSEKRRDEFQLLQAKALVQIGKQVEALTKSLDSWGEAPVEPQSRAARTPKQAAMQKSFANQPGQEDRISKSEVLDLLEQMHMTSLNKGNGGMSRGGEDLQQAIAKYESTMQMTRSLAEELKAFRASSAA